MLALTKKTEYALIALCHLARAGARVVSAREIAGRYSMRLPLLMNVLKLLNQNELLRSTRGAQGGYTLARTAAEISLAHVVAAVEGPTRLVKCVSGRGGDSMCELLRSCPIRFPVHRLQEILQQFLTGATVAELAFDEQFGLVGSGLEPGLLKVISK